MQIQVTRQREEVELMERRLKDEFFSRTDSFAEAIRPAPAVTSIESDMNECMRGVNEASLRSGLRFDGSFGVLKVSNLPAETTALSCAGAAAPGIGYNTCSTQPPIPRSGYGSWGSKSVAILGSNASSVDTSMECQKPGNKTLASTAEARDARQQGQEEPSDVVVTGNAVPSAVQSGVRSSGMHVRVDDSI